MWIQVRTMDGRKSVRIDNLSKLTKIEELREKLVEPFEADVSRQRLFYRGKQLEDGHTLFDYDVGLNEIVQLMIRSVDVSIPAPATQEMTTDKEDDSKKTDSADQTVNAVTNGKSHENGHSETNGDSTEAKTGPIALYKVGNKVDARDRRMGAWFEAQVVKVTIEPTDPTLSSSKESYSSGKSQTKKESEESIKTESEDVLEHMGEEDSLERSGEEESGPLHSSAQPTHSSQNGQTKKKVDLAQTVNGQTVYYHVTFDDYSEAEVTKLTFADIRPRARYRLQWDQLEEGSFVMVNYNPDNPKERGFWYDAMVSRKNVQKKEVFCRLMLNQYSDVAEEVKLRFIDEIFRIEVHDCLKDIEDEESDPDDFAIRRKMPDCKHCKDNPRRKCKHCACSVCGGKEFPDKQILCDECDLAFHIWCLRSPLEEVPEEDEWYCPECKTDCSTVIQAGQKMKMSKKKANMMSNKKESNRDWGKGMACVGRTKQCTIVPSNHFGPIPGVPVGSMWKFRVQVSESGVHRPHVAGIHGREEEGAYSIVLSGGYDDDVDDGEEFMYSGSGGRDLSGNKRTAKQTSDQKLTAMNRALARTCDTTLDDKQGGKARNWKNSKPVRVVRNYKGRKMSDYAPKEGNRYDGIYKVVRYFPEKNSNNLIVWKYHFKRDDPTPAPWTREGKKLIKKLGLTMQYPDGYLESQAAAASKSKDMETSTSGSASSEDEGKRKKGKRGKKRKCMIIDSDTDTSPSKRVRKPRYTFTKEQKTLIKADTVNAKLWDEVMDPANETSAGVLNDIQETFCCIVCQEVVNQPVTIPCGHNICKTCLSRSFKAEVYTCPNCRYELGKDYNMEVNKSLQGALLKLFPGYNGGR